MKHFNININFNPTGNKNEKTSNEPSYANDGLLDFFKVLHRTFFTGLLKRITLEKNNFIKIIFHISAVIAVSCLLRVYFIGFTHNYFKNIHNFARLFSLLFLFDIFSILFIAVTVSLFLRQNSNFQKNLHIALISFTIIIYKFIPLLDFILLLLQLWFVALQSSITINAPFNIKKTFSLFKYLLVYYIIFKLALNFILKIIFPILPCGFIIEYLFRKLL